MRRPFRSALWLVLASIGLVSEACKSSEADQALANESTLRRSIALSNRQNEQPTLSLSVGDPARYIESLGLSRESLIEHYRLYFRYPHNSRPLNDDMTSLLDPLRMRIAPLPIFKAPPTTPLDQPDYLGFFDGLRHSIADDEELVVSFRVADARTAKPVRYVVEKATVLSDLKTGRVELGAVPHVCDSGATRCEFRWKAPAKTRVYWGELTLRLKATINGATVSHDLVFSSTPAPTARFSGQFREHLLDGSLVIHVGVEVAEAGRYVFEGNLFQHPSDEPVAWSRNVVTLAAGAQTVPYVFFGRIFHDKNAQGRFALRQLRGYRLNEPYDVREMTNREAFLARRAAMSPEEQERTLRIVDQPLHQLLASFSGQYLTQPYRFADFSDRLYDGPDKRRVFAGLNALKGVVLERDDRRAM